jgi:hypothetical protein
VVCGGADTLTGQALDRTRTVIEQAVAPAAGRLGAVVVDGGTAAGVMALTGAARASQPDNVPVLVGVAPDGLVSYPDGPAAGDSLAPLDASHSHFILASTDRWGGETRLLMAVAAALAGPGPVAVVVAGGGEVARSEIARARERAWPVLAIAGTGGAADGSAGVRRVSDAAACARELSWELHDDQALKDAWRLFASYDHQAKRLRATFTRLLALTLALAVLATVLAATYTQVGGSALHWAAVVVPALSSVLILVSGRRSFGQRWVLMRGAAESVKAEIYLHRAAPAMRRVGSQRKLLNRLALIERQLMLTAASHEPLPAYRGQLPPLTGPLTAESGPVDDGLGPLNPGLYLRTRLEDQIGYYERRARRLSRWRNALYLLAFLAGAAGTILAAAHREVWVSVTASMSAAALAYLGYLQFDGTIVGYNQTVAKLSGLVREWRALRPSQRSAKAFERLVTQSEQALATEVAGWVKHQADALADTAQPEGSLPGC